MVPPRPGRVRSEDRLLPPRPVAATVTMLLFAALLYVIEAFDQLTGETLDAEGIWPRDVDHLDGVLWSPLLHGGWVHLEGNTLPLLIFGFLAMAGGIGQWVLVTAIIWLLGGLGVWLLGPDGLPTVGASGVIFGWLVFLLARGFFVHSGRQIGLAAVLFFFWGGLLWGILPSQPYVSWQAHLCGALAGLLAARVVARTDGRSPRRGVAG